VTGLALAVERKEWRRLALCLLLGMGRVLERVPNDSLEELLALLGDDPRPAGGGRER
jgi:hypothetical protein